MKALSLVLTVLFSFGLIFSNSAMADSKTKDKHHMKGKKVAKTNMKAKPAKKVVEPEEEDDTMMSDDYQDQENTDADDSEVSDEE